jgi:putative transposase
LITTIFHEHKGRYGYRRIQAELKWLYGLTINHKKVYRLMKELGLSCQIRKKKYTSFKGRVGKEAPNIINRQFEADKHNQKWATDITEFKLFHKKFYLSPILDMYNGEIIAYSISNSPSKELVDDMLKQAFKKFSKKDEIILHSDQGWHYRTPHYQRQLKERGIIQSMSRKGNCFDNAVIENFFGILKSEFLYYQTFRDTDHFLKSLKAYIKYYNHKRLKSRLGTSPVQYRLQQKTNIA